MQEWISDMPHCPTDDYLQIGQVHNSSGSKVLTNTASGPILISKDESFVYKFISGDALNTELHTRRYICS